MTDNACLRAEEPGTGTLLLAGNLGAAAARAGGPRSTRGARSRSSSRRAFDTGSDEGDGDAEGVAAATAA